MKKISVIIPSKDRLDFTREAIESVYQQRLHSNYELELILVDDLSTPPLEKNLKKEFPSVRYMRNTSKIHGPGSSRNLGLRKATGDYICFLDNDDQWKPNFLSRAIDHLEIHGSPATVCLTQPYFYGTYPFFQKVKLHILNIIRLISISGAYIMNNKKLPKSAFYLCQISHMVFDARVAKKYEFNTKLIAAEDWDYIVKCTKRSEVGIVLWPHVKFRYEIRSNTNTETVRNKKWLAYKAMLRGIPSSHKKGFFYVLFLQYIKVFQ